MSMIEVKKERSQLCGTSCDFFAMYAFYGMSQKVKRGTKKRVCRIRMFERRARE